jgi:manganese-dependent ADP-ribose/CDP-alcohol diphosphatase
VPAGWNFSRTTERAYRGALEALRQAVTHWNAESVDFVIQLGDIIDGQCAALGQTESASDAVMEQLNRCSCEVYNCIGNHELYPHFILWPGAAKGAVFMT